VGALLQGDEGSGLNLTVGFVGSTSAAQDDAIYTAPPRSPAASTSSEEGDDFPPVPAALSLRNLSLPPARTLHPTVVRAYARRQ
jgi:hypothetical protein